MVEAASSLSDQDEAGVPSFGAATYTYDQWMQSVGIPIHKGYFIPNLSSVELAWWEERGCQAAFIQLMGQEGIIEARVSEIPPGESLPPFKLAVDEVVYVVSGRGLTSVWTGSESRRTVEWQAHSMFLLPRNRHHQFSNTQGDAPVRLLHYNYLPLAMTTVADPQFFFNNPYDAPEQLGEGSAGFYSEARSVSRVDRRGRDGYLWLGNFFPDMRSWDKLESNQTRGAGGHSVNIQFPGSEMSSHMSVFDPRLYKKAHRQGPGRVIVIPAGGRVLHSVGGRQGEDRSPLAGSQRLRSPQPVVPPALQRGRRPGTIPGASSTHPVPRLHRRVGRGPVQRPDRIRRGAQSASAGGEPQDQWRHPVRARQ